MAEQVSSVPADAVLVLDRFVSASSARDAVESLEAIEAGFKSSNEPWEQSWILDNTELVDHLTHLLQHGTLKNGDLPCGDEGINLVCQIYQTSLAKNSQSLKEPQPGQLLEALIDVMDSSDRQIYTRVLALQVLEQLSKNHSSLASSQWLQAPNGLHRLADMLSLGVDNPVEEVIRNQALVVAHFLAREAPISKVFLFAEVETKLLDLCWQQGGLTKGNSVVLDCLKLVEEMLKHADANLQDLVWQRPPASARLAQLIDLRGADEFLHPDEHKKKQKVKQTAVVLDDDDDDDDLDSLLQSGDSKKQESPKKDSQQDWFIPRLSSDEESIVDNVIRILHLLLEADSLRPTIWKAHGGLCSLVWELALVNPANPAVCAMPNAAIQQKALELVAMKFNDPETMDRHAGLDRLLFLVCTGGANAEAYKEKMATSQAALSVLRKTINTDRVHGLLLHTLAPPPEDEGAPAGPTVVEKLWNTVVENLSMSNTDGKGDETRSIFLSGALGGLSLLLCDEQSREMMSRVVPDAVNPDVMLEALQSEKNSVVQWTLLRFLCEWIMETPLMVQKLLNSSASTILADMASDSKKNYAPLVHLLLGLAMEYLRGDEQDCGGWTRAGILQVIKKIGISKFTTSLERLKKVQDCDLPCYVSPPELGHWKKWYSQAVWVVRKRVVDELTGGEPSSESDGDEPEGLHSSITDPGSNKHLQKLIAQQAREIETLRQDVENARIKVSSQEHQLDTWKRRMESTPTELDGLLSEMTNKTATLEETIAKLESKAKEEKAAHEEDLSKLNKQLTDVRQEVETSRTAEKEAVEGWERMEQELGALSQAYSSLEQDFQREKSNHEAAIAAAADAATTTPAGESGTQQQDHGERSEQRSSSGSLEVATLRAENDRLRNDARAADEWMKMAVDKMNEMGQNSARLQQEAESLRARVKNLENQDAANKAANAKQLGEKEQKLQEQLSGLEAQLQEAQALRAADSGNAEQQAIRYEEEKCKMQEHIRKVESQLQDERSALLAATTNAKEAEEKYQHIEEEMKRDIMALKASLNQEGHSEIGAAGDASQLQASHDAIVEELRQQIFDLEAQLEEKTSEEFKEGGPLSGEGPAASTAMDEQLVAVRRELETNREHFDEDIYKKESIIRELEDRLRSGLGPYTMEDIRSRDEEIEEFRSANEAAQEWMAKAVDHHQMLATQVAALSEEKVSLTGKIESLERENTSTGANTEIISMVQSQLQQKIELAESVSAELAQCKGELTKMNEERETLEHTKQDLSIARDEIESLQEKVRQLESGAGEKDGNALRLENERLQNSNAELKENLDQFTTWAADAQKKIAEIVSEKQVHEKTIKDLKASNSTLAQNEIVLNEKLEAKEMERSQLEISLIEKDKLVVELTSEKEKLKAVLNEERDGGNKLKADLTQQAEEAKSTIVKLENNVASSDAKRSELECQVETLQAEKVALEKVLEDRKGEARTFEDDKEILEEKLASLEVAIDEELHEINRGEMFSTVDGPAEIAKLREELEAARTTIAQDEDVVHQWKDRVAELESMIHSLESQLEEQEKEANDVVSQWQETYSESEEKCAALEKELAQIRSRIESPDATQDDATQNRVVQLETIIQSLESQLEEQEKEANDVVSQWEETYSESEAKCTSLEKELAAARSGTESLGDEMQDLVSELESTIKSLESQLLEQEKEANDAISQWQESYSESEEKCVALEIELSTLRLEIKSPGTIQDDAMQNRVLELESTVKSLESQLQEQEKVANGVVSQWQENYNAADEKCVALEKQLETVRSEMECSEAPKNDEMQARVSELESSVQSLESQLEEQEQEASDVVSRWQESYTAAEENCAVLEKELTALQLEMESSKALKSDAEDRISELESTIQSLESQLQAQDDEANDVIAKWRENSSKAEEKCAALEDELVTVRSEMEALKTHQADTHGADIAAHKTRIQELERKTTCLEEEIYSLNKANEQQQELSAENLSRLEKDLSASNASCEEVSLKLQKFQDEINSLKQALDEKANELEESNCKREAMEASRQTLEQEYQAMRQQIQSNPPERVSELVDQLQESQDNLAVAQEALRNDEEVVRQWEERAADLESTIQNLETQLHEQESEANVVISEWQRQSSELEEQLTQMQQQVHSINEALAARDATIESLKGVATENSSQEKAWRDDMERLRGELDDEKKRNEEAKDEIGALSITLDELKTESTNASQKLKDEIVGLNVTIESLMHDAEEQEQASKKDMAALESKISEYEDIVLALKADLDARSSALENQQKEASQNSTLELESRMMEYKQIVSTLEGDLSSKTKALSDLQEAAQKDVSDSELRLAEYEEKVSALEADIESKIAVVSDLKEDIVEKSEALSRQELRLDSLESESDKHRIEIEDLKNEIVSKEAEIEDLKQSDLTSMTKTELIASRAENELLHEKLQSEQEARKLETEKFEKNLASESLKLKEARDEVEEIRKESEDVVNQWTARVDELEGTVVELEVQLQHQEEEANVAISSWESKTVELERDLETSMGELNSLKGRLTELENSKSDKMITQNLEAENSRLTTVIGQLEEELREANTMIQTYVTNEAAEKATEAAASSLRDEIDELQRAIDGYKQQLANEQSSREVAELEIERLRDDTATLAALTNQSDSAEGVELRTVRAAEQLKKKDRIEIESLRNSLYRALNDVESAQTAEREAVNQLAKMQLATSIAEKDIVTAKSEIHFLSQALEESRLAEENRRASLEYRISSLEDDNDLLRKYHADELEEVRQELSQIIMEKDRAIHQIRELERSNAALVAAASKEDIYALDDQADLEHEIARLRVENEHLLTVAADDKGRAERKLREMLAAQMASIEADTILEHELRVNAEESIVALKAQVEELKKASFGRTDGSGNEKEITSTSASTQIKALKEALDQVTKEKKVLKQKLEREASKARASIEKLTEECRQAQSELHKNMRDNRYDQAVKSEVSKLHMSPPRRRMPMTPESRDDVLMQTSILDTSVTSINAATFDQLQNFKEEMQEERKIYLELLAEHEDLLALLAQLDVEKNSLKDALAKVAGQEAVNEALQKAEEKTFEEHGGIIKLADDSDDDFAAVTDME